MKLADAFEHNRFRKSLMTGVKPLPEVIADKERLKQVVSRAVDQTPVTDIHTHLYAPAFGDLGLWGVDHLLSYHYLIAETMRQTSLSYEDFWSLDRRGMADHVWKTLFIDRSPYSEACRGVLTTLGRLGMDVASRDLSAYRKWYDGQTYLDFVDRVFSIAKVKAVVMTNDPFDPKERELWLRKEESLLQDRRFYTSLRIDPLLYDWENQSRVLREMGYEVGAAFSPEDRRTREETIRFLVDWGRRMKALYLAASFPPDFDYPADSTLSALLDHCVLEACGRLNIPFAMMIGVKRRVNPSLGLAGDRVGRAKVEAVERICARHPQRRFLVTMLARENQHELIVLARKFRNLMVFGCWWFLNNPSLVEEITAMRCEMLGTAFIPQHSDARVLDQLIYKWDHSRRVIARVLHAQYEALHDTGWRMTPHEIERDVRNLLDQNFWTFVKGG